MEKEPKQVDLVKKEISDMDKELVEASWIYDILTYRQFKEQREVVSVPLDLPDNSLTAVILEVVNGIAKENQKNI